MSDKSYITTNIFTTVPSGLKRVTWMVPLGGTRYPFLPRLIWPGIMKKIVKWAHFCRNTMYSHCYQVNDFQEYLFQPLGISANTDTSVRQRGELGQTWSHPTLETSKHPPPQIFRSSAVSETTMEEATTCAFSSLDIWRACSLDQSRQAPQSSKIFQKVPRYF